MDLYFYTIQFAKDNNFSREKISTVFSIVKKTHEVCIGMYCHCCNHRNKLQLSTVVLLEFEKHSPFKYSLGMKFKFIPINIFKVQKPYIIQLLVTIDILG